MKFVFLLSQTYKFDYTKFYAVKPNIIRLDFITTAKRYIAMCYSLFSFFLYISNNLLVEKKINLLTPAQCAISKPSNYILEITNSNYK